MLQGPKAVLNPVAPLPGPDEPRPTDVGLHTEQVVQLHTGLTDDDEGHGSIRWTGGPQPHITHSRHVRALTPGPLAGLLHVTPLDLAPIGQCKGVGTLPFHEECTPVGRRDMAHELRIAKPTIGHNYRRRQRHATSAERRHASIEHDLEPVQFVPARRPRPYGVWPTNGKVDGDDQFALADDDDEEDPINAGEDPVFLPTPPGTYEAQLLAIFFEYRVIAHPGPLPAAARRGTCGGGIAPQRDQHLQTQAAEPLEPRALGQRTEQA